MTLNEASRQLKAIQPNRTTAVNAILWTRPDGTQYVQYSVSIFAVNGQSCLNYESTITLANAVDKAIAGTPDEIVVLPVVPVIADPVMNEDVDTLTLKVSSE